jgi:hypothetical protein
MTTSTFRYLRVPADDTASVEELEAPPDSSGGDQLPQLLSETAFIGGAAVPGHSGGKTETFALVVGAYVCGPYNQSSDDTRE